MRKAKIYFNDSLVATVSFNSIMYIGGRELRDCENKLVAVVPLSHMIIIEDTDIFEIKGSDLVKHVARNCSDRNTSL